MSLVCRLPVSGRLAHLTQSSVAYTCSRPSFATLKLRPDFNGRNRRNHMRMPNQATAAPEMGTPVAVEATEAGYEPSDFAAAMASQYEEFDYWITDIEGELPDALRGTLFRNGPGRFERGGQKYAHKLDGDGYVCSFSFNNEGKAHFRSRYVQTSDIQREAEAGKILYRTIFGTMPKRRFAALQNIVDLYVKNPANTNVVLWGEKLIALWEGGAPYALDPHTLETHPGLDSLDGFLPTQPTPQDKAATALHHAVGEAQDAATGTGTSVKQGSGKAVGKLRACTAHPHVVHGNGLLERLALYSSEIKVDLRGFGMQVEVAEFDEQWQRVAGQSFRMDNTVFVPHDFAVSQNYYVFWQSATGLDLMSFLLAKKAAAECLNLTDEPTKIHVVPRNGDPPIVIDNVEPCFLIHHANAYEDGDELVSLAIGWGPDIVRESAAQEGSGVFGSFAGGNYNLVPITSLFSHRINLKTKEVKRENLSPLRNDHPKVNPFFYSKPTRYVYVNTCVPEGNNMTNPPQAFSRIDTHTGERQTWAPGVRCFCEELVFMPGPNAATQETDGYLLGLTYDAAVNKTCLAVLDAADFSKGPVAKLWLKHHVPHGLHGFWSPTYFGPST